MFDHHSPIVLRCAYFFIALVAGISLGFSALVPTATAQAGDSVPVIRTQAREVLVPARVNAHLGGSDYDVLKLRAGDFRVYEDGKEQPIKEVTLERMYDTPTLTDNLGAQESEAYTPTGKWSNLREALFHRMPFFEYYYLITYEPPVSSEGRCHKINVRINPNDALGGRLTTATDDPVWTKKGTYTRRIQVDRRNLHIQSRTQYCNTPHPATDPLYGTPISKKMEAVAVADKAREEGLAVNATDFYDGSQPARVHVTLDFRSISDQAGSRSFAISLLGIIYKQNGVLAARFSDAKQDGCFFSWYDFDDPEFTSWSTDICKHDGFTNHYETQVQLPPGEFNLLVVLDFGGDLRRSEIPVTVRDIGSGLAISGIALCKRFYPYKEELQTPPEASDQPNIPVMPFELRPLVSKGIEFTPTGETHFKRKEPLAAYFEVYEPLTQGRDTHVQFQMKIRDAKTGEIKSDTGLRPADSYINLGKAKVPISQQIAISELPSGTYRLDVQAFDSGGGHAESPSRVFTVER